MNSNDLILHAYDASPFTQKTLRMLGLKGCNYYSVETPMILPKPDLVCVTGGYRGTPVLQIGSNVYIDNQRIATELESRFPEPSLFARHNEGLYLSMVNWSDTFFRAGLHMVIALQSQQWPEEFLADRKALFSKLDFEQISADVNYAKAQLRANAALINMQLADGRMFIGGDAPSLADIHAFAIPWFTRAAMPEVNTLLADLEHLPAWEQRVADIGEGTRKPIDAEQAHTVARESVAVYENRIDAIEPGNFQVGQQVTVRPDDAERGAVSGQLQILCSDEIVITHKNEKVGEVAVHFPRLGHRVFS